MMGVSPDILIKSGTERSWENIYQERRRSGMFFKWTGGLSILFAGSGMGVWLAWGYKKDYRHWKHCGGWSTA